ncbi:hypothetical protein [Pontimicrobium sp. SW4]|uniref:Macroglobulin domain-containing protein n=1 Tax=Pontimicrobium sp. SW4 TaxID=3153519 RepID=A0AAU7BV02_9FLAO
MKKRIIVLLICFASSISITKAVNIVSNQTETLPQESIFVHLNSSLFLAGENLYYKVYCLNDKVNQLSTLSKIAYVELVGENHEVVFKHKIKLDSGVGYGDFVIPTSVNSGNYMLIAYTQWMKNAESDYFFKGNVAVINPFQNNQEAILADSEKQDSTFNIATVNEIRENVNSQFLEITTNRKKFQKRSKGSLILKNISNKNLKGNYSISIRKIDALDRLVSKAKSANTFVSEQGESGHDINKINYLPELRGELISGKLIKITDDKPAVKEKVSLSINEKDFILKVANTDDNGVFYFNINNDYNNENAVLQVLDRDNKDYRIILDEHSSVDYNTIDFGEMKISSKYRKPLEQRSIYNQIENGYFSLKPNTLKPIDTIRPFFETYHATFYLDDYTRFSKVRETFIEVIKDSYIQKDNNNKTNFYVTSLNPYERLEKPAGVIVDGILLQSFDEFLEYDSRRIKKISIARTETNFILGSKIFGGFIVVETFDGDFYKELPKENVTMVKLFKPQPKKNYFKKDYENVMTTNRIPDYRSQLLWEPNVKMEEKELIFNFFTSDNSGEFEIRLEGFTANGNPVSISSFITVE